MGVRHGAGAEWVQHRIILAAALQKRLCQSLICESAAASSLPLGPPLTTPNSLDHLGSFPNIAPMSLQTSSHTSTHAYNDKFSAGVGMWTEAEHIRFLEGVKLFSNGPWKRVAAYVGTRNVRQTMTHAQKYRLKAARRLREAQRKQAAARHGLHSSNRDNNALTRRSLHSPPAGGLGLGAYSKLKLPCSCIEKDCPHMEEDSKIYMSIADAIEILDSKSNARSPVSPDETFGSSWLTIDTPIKAEVFANEDLAPLDSAASDSDEFPTLEDCASELLELLF